MIYSAFVLVGSKFHPRGAEITGHPGVLGLIEAFRQTVTAAVIDREIQLKSRKRGLSAAEMVESLLALWAGGRPRSGSPRQDADAAARA